MGFTHIELLPISEHPFDGSWGYQPTGLFAPTSRFGSPADFTALIDACHRAGLGVLLDWVPGHFPDDPHGLAQFDGTALYEHANPQQGRHLDWGTLIYNYGRVEVDEFPDRQRAVLARALRHRRAARRCGRLHALSRLQPAGRRLDPEPLRRPREHRGHRVSAPHQHAGVRPPSARDHGGRGIHRLADGVAAGRLGRPRLRLQVEHGVDARHPGLHLEGPDPSPPPSRQHPVRPALRVLRKLHPAAVARRGGARQALDPRPHAGRPVAALRQSARLLRLHVRPSRQEADVHGLRVRARTPSGITT